VSRPFCENLGKLSQGKKGSLDGVFVAPSPTRTYWGLFSEEGKEEGQQDADDDAGHEGEIEGELVPLDDDIAGELADPGNLIA